MKPNNPTARMAPKVIIDMKDPPENTPTKITVPKQKTRETYIYISLVILSSIEELGNI